jgi:hypothetical protein
MGLATPEEPFSNRPMLALLDIGLVGSLLSLLRSPIESPFLRIVWLYVIVPLCVTEEILVTAPVLSATKVLLSAK